MLASAQTPTPPRPNPAQQDATRPPGVERPSPQAPPGTTGSAPQPAPPVVQPPTTLPERTVTPERPVTDRPPSAESPATNAGQEPERTPLSPLLQSRSLPPLPSLSRLGVTGDSTLALSLKDAVRLVLERNNDIEVARGNVRFAEANLRALEGIYEPIFQIEPQVINRVTPVASVLGGSNQSGTVTTTDLNFNHSVTKLFQKGGGQYQFFFNNTRETTSSTFSQLNPFYSSNFGAQFTQPLLRNRSIDRNRRDIRIQRKRLAQSDADFRRQVTDVIAQVQRAYWDLVFALRDQQNRLANLNLTRELYRQTETRIAAGAVAPLERAEVQTELANRESELLVSSEYVSFAENNLKRLILRDPLASEWSTALVPTDEPSFDQTPVNLADALTEARANRPELGRLRLQREVNDIDIQYFTDQTRPRIDIQSSVSTTGLAGSPVIPTGTLTGGLDPSVGAIAGQVPLIAGNPATSASAFLLDQINQLRAAQGKPAATVPLVTTQTRVLPENLVGGYFQTLRNLFSLNTRNIVAGVVIEIPFHNRRAEAELAGARIERSQLEASTRAQEQIIEVEVRNAAQAVETARRRVVAAREARRYAELQLEGERRLYQVGRSTTFLLFQRENQLSNARNLELRAGTDYNKALADLQRATSTTLRANNVIVETPTDLYE